MTTSLTFDDTGTFVQTGGRDGPPPIDRGDLPKAEGAFFDRVRARIADAQEHALHRSIRLDPAQSAKPFQVARPRSINERPTWRKMFDHDPRLPVVLAGVASSDWLRQARERVAILRHGARPREWRHSAIPRLRIEKEPASGAGARLYDEDVALIGDWIERVLRVFNRLLERVALSWINPFTHRIEAAFAKHNAFDPVGERDGAQHALGAGGQARPMGAIGAARLIERRFDGADRIDGAPLLGTWAKLIRTALALAAPFGPARVAPRLEEYRGAHHALSHRGARDG